MESRTIVQDNNLSPQWNATFDLTSMLNHSISHIEFLIWDKNAQLADFLGKARLEFNRAPVDAKKVFKLALGPGYQLQDSPALRASSVVVELVPSVGTHVLQNPLFNPEDIWSLSPVKLKQMFNEIDKDNSGSLSKAEFLAYARAYYEKNIGDYSQRSLMTRQECEAQVLKNRPLKDHLMDLLGAYDAMDTDGDQTISLREFILKWNEVAREVYSRPTACSVM
jgi:hypothetical protein